MFDPKTLKKKNNNKKKKAFFQQLWPICIDIYEEKIKIPFLRRFGVHELKFEMRTV